MLSLAAGPGARSVVRDGDTYVVEPSPFDSTVQVRRNFGTRTVLVQASDQLGAVALIDIADSLRPMRARGLGTVDPSNGWATVLDTSR